MRTSLRRALVSVVLTVSLASLSVAPVLAAAGLSPAAAAPAASSMAGFGLGAQLWSWVRTIWPESGCTIDPSGQCAKAAPRPGAPAGALAAPPRLIPSAGSVRP
jgi:hypothetical protein